MTTINEQTKISLKLVIAIAGVIFAFGCLFTEVAYIKQQVKPIPEIQKQVAVLYQMMTTKEVAFNK